MGEGHGFDIANSSGEGGSDEIGQGGDEGCSEEGGAENALIERELGLEEVDNKGASTPSSQLHDADERCIMRLTEAPSRTRDYQVRTDS